MRVTSSTERPIPLVTVAPKSLEKRTQQLGQQLLGAMRERRPSSISSRAMSEKLMDWAMRDPSFKVQMFRYVDTFPTLRDPQQIHSVLLDYLQQPGVQVPPGMGLGLKAGGVLKGTLAKTMTSNIRRMAENFIAGRDAESALPQLHKLWKQGIGFSVDLLGEACVSEEEAWAYQERYLDLLQTLPTEVERWIPNTILESDHLGAIPRCNISLKISSLSSQIRLEDFEGSIERLYKALSPILEMAGKQNVTVNFDMEQFQLKDLTLSLFERCCERIDFPASLAMQAYLRSGSADAQRLIDWSRGLGRPITVRLIKGAYWDYEVIHAEQRGWPIPVWTCKADTDACFERMTAQFLDATPRRADEGGIKLALGSHNVRSIAYAQALLEARNLPSDAIEYQLLEGMADDLRTTLVDTGKRVRAYLPLGEMIPGMAYLVRRLLENTSNESWLRGSQSQDVTNDQLLLPPEKMQGFEESITEFEHAPRHQLSTISTGVDPGLAFFNEPFRDFSNASQRHAFARAVTEAELPSVSFEATVADADQALTTASQSTWGDRDILDRSATLLETAAWLRDRRDMLSGVIIREAGKTWSEADADVCEAIDFCEFYAREAVPLFRPQRLGNFIGELNELRHRPAGVAAIISPWNFPLAICTGMTVASLACGNSTIVKPAPQTPATARLICEALWECGVPTDALQFLPGPGSTVGAYLTEDPRVDVVGFTGSREVGFQILRAAGQMTPDIPNAKKVICEMGGKNTIIVDSTADLDEAVLGVRHSAFGFAGQKCSACSRVVVLQDAYEPFLKRLIEATSSLTVGDPLDPATDVGPVIDAAAAKKIQHYIEIAQQENHLALRVPVPRGLESAIGKPVIGPHIFTRVQPTDTIAREEIFGPVLAVMVADSFEQAIEIANQSPYKLTGGVFSRTPRHLQYARQQFHVGNLYLNQGCTGALVGRQPFGGFGHSGTGTKAGGSDYLKHFVNPVVCTENTMRRGFAPGLN